MGSKVPIWKLIYDTIVAIINIGTFYRLLSFFDNIFYIFFGLTYWGFLSGMLYLVAICILEWLQLFNIAYDTKFEDFMRNIYLKFAMAFQIGIVILYWLFIILDIFAMSDDKMFNFLLCYMHGITCLFSFVDIFFGKHRYVPHFWFDVTLIIGLFFIYWGLIAIAKFALNFAPYPFVEHASAKNLVAAGILEKMVIINSYGLYQLLAYFYYEGGKKSYKLTEGDDDKKIDLSKEDNIQPKKSLINDSQTGISIELSIRD